MPSQKEEYEHVIYWALESLYESMSNLAEDTIPYTPMPRPKFFQNDYVVWPGKDYDKTLSFFYITIINKDKPQNTSINPKAFGNTLIPQEIAKVCEYQPAKIMAVVELIEQASKWCLERKQGREKHAQEIIRQQQKAQDKINDKITIAKIKKVL